VLLKQYTNLDILTHEQTVQMIHLLKYSRYAYAAFAQFL